MYVHASNLHLFSSKTSVLFHQCVVCHIVVIKTGKWFVKTEVLAAIVLGHACNTSFCIPDSQVTAACLLCPSLAAQVVVQSVSVVLLHSLNSDSDPVH